MRSVSDASRTRARNASDGITTRGPIHIDESRVNTRFGNGSMTKSPPWCIRNTNDTSVRVSDGSSLKVMPAVSTCANLPGSRLRR
ncbi:Uncharacterised protein [Mycobacterium tuberculosis]|uniref:Uncharacterized protein n=1 Tax=Mycobacterium tuberculosis TaxID=1773 RepID=A0A655C0S0_MYCTX|nr:Uncharacterised protein [Mycobacterium tuberculosis]CKS90572.1 Uncharacterised protein [Mycobacterium tuberculosis]CNT90558.1 Uncharacterised protein [Mycobacterium tuberculosis]CNU11956.1 Uncharacterised protein [Mycobacterium tuberculosis]CNV82132.1 Uncharacterised protein [Mycobacterium tuberculosis]